MKRTLLGAACLVLLMSTTLVHGQNPYAPYGQKQFQLPPIYQKPNVSPYLNLLRRGSSPAINYYGLVKPQIDFRNNIRQLQTDVVGVEQQVTTTNQQLANPALPPTGHQAGFMTHGRYFMNNSAR